ncbi:MAG: alpha-keto acid decarboxylase family protein [Sarcina sp.]
MKIKIGDYLIEKLKELNVDSVYGVPGDYNLGFLDHIDDAEGIEWVGNCNELNAAYAADGYARIKGFAAMVTTFGVGELSAVNGIAGSYAESVPVVKITGMPTTEVQENRLFVHHTLGDGEFNRFSKMFEEITVSQTILTEMNAKSEIDRVLKDCYVYKKPVYIGLPVDVAEKEIDVEMTKIDLDVKSNETTLAQFVEAVSEQVASSKGQFLLADYEVIREGLENKLSDFINDIKIPAGTLCLGKTAIDETNEYYAGMYAGKLSSKLMTDVINASDLGIYFGVKLTDCTTAGFSYINSNLKTIEILANCALVNGKKFKNIRMRDAIDAIQKAGLSFKNSVKVVKEEEPKFVATNDDLVQNRFFKQIENFMDAKDVLVAETGTSFYGAATLTMPKAASFVGQALWGSIGYALPAVLGTQMADRSRRNILVIGDGSLQLTAQEISTMLRQDTNPILFVINNDGYTIERVIHGPRREYNDINMWNYAELGNVFGLRNRKSLSFKVKTEKELEEAMNTINANREQLAIVEVIMDMDDAPKFLVDVAEHAFKKQNAY